MNVELLCSGENSYTMLFEMADGTLSVQKLTNEDLKLIRDRANYFVTLNEERERLSKLQKETIRYVWNPKSRRHELEK